MPKITKEVDNGLHLAELVSAVKENTNMLQQNITETRQLAEILMPALKKTETVRFKKLQEQELMESCLKTIRGTNA